MDYKKEKVILEQREYDYLEICKRYNSICDAINELERTKSNLSLQKSLVEAEIILRKENIIKESHKHYENKLKECNTYREKAKLYFKKIHELLHIADKNTMHNIYLKYKTYKDRMKNESGN